MLELQENFGRLLFTRIVYDSTQLHEIFAVDPLIARFDDFFDRRHGFRASRMRKKEYPMDSRL